MERIEPKVGTCVAVKIEVKPKLLSTILSTEGLNNIIMFSADLVEQLVTNIENDNHF